MRGQERIPLHDHIDNNSGGRIAGGSIVSAVGGSAAGGSSGGGLTVHAVEGPYHNTAETDTSLVLRPDGTGGVEWGVDATGGALGWFLPEDYGAVGDDSTDDTTAMQAWLAALNAAGRGFAYLGGRYKVTAAIGSVTVPCTILGAGMAGNEIPGAAASYIHYVGTSAHVLDVDSHGVKIEGLGFVQTGGAPTSGCEAIRAGHTTAADFFQLIGCSTSGFYHAVNLENGTGMTIDRNLIHGFAHHGLDALYISVPDGLDSQITNNHFDGATYSAGVAIYLQSGGGAKLIGNKVNSNSGLVYGIFLDIPAGVDASLLIIDGNSIEGWDDTGIKITSTAGTSIVRGIVIVGNEIAMTTGGSNKKCIDVVGAETNDLYEVIVVGNKCGIGSSTGPAIGMTNVNWPLVGNNTWSGYDHEATFTTCSNVRDATGMVGAGVVISGTPSSGDVPIASSGIAAAWGTPSASGVTVQDEGSSLATSGTTLNFVGSGVTASGTGATKTITIPGGGIGPILISDSPSTPLIFADLIQNEAQDDLVYADP